MGLGGMTLSVSAALGSIATSRVEDTILVDNAKSIIFDGVDEYITLPQGVITSTGNFSFSCWFKMTDTTGTRCLVEFHDSSSTDGMQIVSASSSDTIDVSIKNNSGTSFAWRSPSFSLDTWYHLVATKTTGTIGSIYINGVQTDSAGSEVALFSYGQDAIGSRRSSEWTNGWEGNLDEIGIWNSVLSEQEVTQIYNGGNARLDLSSNTGSYSSSVNLAGWWRMGDEADT